MAKYADDNGLTHFAGLIITWVKGLLSSTNPLMDGTATPGTAKMLAREDHVHPTDTSRAASSHTHGNITNGGDITASAPTVASGDKLIINDESASKITNGPSFGTSTTTYLRNDGIWDTPAGTTYSDFTGATSSAAGAHGLVPQPTAGKQLAMLLGNAEWWNIEVAGSHLSINWNNTSKTVTIGSSAEANQNAFSNVKVGSTTVAADSKTDTLELVAGENVALTPDATNDKITIAATDTDTKNTAGSTDSSSKLFIIGATSQAANPQTYSQDTAYVGTDGHLYSNSKKVVNLSDSQDLTNKTYNGYTLGAACAKAIGSVADNDTGLVTGDAVYDAIQSALGTMADALVYKGTIGISTDSPTITALPANHSKGDVYIVKSANQTYAGVGCEVGDMIICNTDGTTANNAHWDVIQSNIEALTNPEITTIWNNAVTANW